MDKDIFELRKKNKSRWFNANSILFRMTEKVIKKIQDFSVFQKDWQNN